MTSAAGDLAGVSKSDATVSCSGPGRPDKLQLKGAVTTPVHALYHHSQKEWRLNVRHALESKPPCSHRVGL